MSLESNKKLVAEFFNTFATRDVDRCLSMMTDDATWLVPGRPELFSISGLKTKTEMAMLLRGLMDATTQGLVMKQKGVIAEGDKVAFEGESHAPLKNGKVYNNHYHFLVTLRDGKVASVREYLDTMHTADVLSEMIPPPKAA